MPTYQYRCTTCGRDLEVVQKFSDPSLTECPECSGALKKVFNAVGVVFKGSGFYRTDSRNGKSATIDASSSSSADATDSGSAAKDGGTKDSGTKDGGTKDGGPKDGGTTSSSTGTKEPAKSTAPKASSPSNSPAKAGAST